MTKPYYELHVTCIGDKAVVQAAVEKIGWSFSAIDKDIILGEGIKCYATKHFSKRTSHTTLRQQLDSATFQLKISTGVKVIRKKMEEVLYDERKDL